MTEEQLKKGQDILKNISNLRTQYSNWTHVIENYICNKIPDDKIFMKFSDVSATIGYIDEIGANKLMETFLKEFRCKISEKIDVLETEFEKL